MKRTFNRLMWFLFVSLFALRYHEVLYLLNFLSSYVNYKSNPLKNSTLNPKIQYWNFQPNFKFIFCFPVNLLNLMYGLAAGWTSASLLILESEETSPLQYGALDEDERSWVTSLLSISGVFGTIIYYHVADFCGRKFSLMSMALPHAVSTNFIIDKWPSFRWNVISMNKLQHWKLI